MNPTAKVVEDFKKRMKQWQENAKETEECNHNGYCHCCGKPRNEYLYEGHDPECFYYDEEDY